MPNEITVAQSNPTNPTTTAQETQTDANLEAAAEKLLTDSLGEIDKNIKSVIDTLPQESQTRAYYDKAMASDGGINHFERVALIHMIKADLASQPDAFNGFLEKIRPHCEKLGINCGQEKLLSASKSGPQLNDGSVGGLARYQIDQEYQTIKAQQTGGNTNVTQSDSNQNSDPVLQFAQQNHEAVSKAIETHKGQSSTEVQKAAFELLTTGSLSTDTQKLLADPQTGQISDETKTAVMTLYSAAYGELQQQLNAQKTETSPEPSTTDNSVTTNDVNQDSPPLSDSQAQELLSAAATNPDGVKTLIAQAAEQLKIEDSRIVNLATKMVLNQKATADEGRIDMSQVWTLLRFVHQALPSLQQTQSNGNSSNSNLQSNLSREVQSRQLAFVPA
jgi:hypothetical protein